VRNAGLEKRMRSASAKGLVKGLCGKAARERTDIEKPPNLGKGAEKGGRKNFLSAIRKKGYKRPLGIGKRDFCSGEWNQDHGNLRQAKKRSRRGNDNFLPRRRGKSRGQEKAQGRSVKKYRNTDL